MAEEEKKANFFQKVLQFFIELLEPGIDLLRDSQSRGELLATLGLEATADAPDIPEELPALRAYIDAASSDEQAGIFELAGAVADLTRLTLAIEGFFQGVISATEDEPSRSASEFVSLLINILGMEYIRRRVPVLHSVIRLLEVIDSTAAASGGSVNLFEDVIIPYFKRLGDGLDTEESTQTLSDVVFITVAVGLYIADYIIKHQGSEAVEIRAAYGYEAFESSVSPIADRISNRALSYMISGRTDLGGDAADLPTKIDFFNTLLFVPREQGGVALVTDLLGKLELHIPFDGNKSFGFELAGEGIARIGTEPEIESGDETKIAVSFRHEREKPEQRTAQNEDLLIDIGLGTYTVTLSFSPTDFEVKLKPVIYIKITRSKEAGFPLSLLGEKIADEEIKKAFGYSLEKGFFIDGDGSPGRSDEETEEEDPDIVALIAQKLLNLINVRIPVHKDLGGVFGLENIYLKTHANDGLERIDFEASIDFWLKLGPPVLVTVNQLGIQLPLTKRADSGGLLGYDIGAKFKPPTGAGIRIDAEIVKGGGFLYFDDDNGEYFGALELEFKELFALKAVGLINTRFPDGSTGFSMLIIITAEFQPINLPFGFTLNGVGGLLGLHRTVEIETLRLGIRTNAIKSILFPEDVVGNIHRIISDLRQIFPVRRDYFLIGLMGKFGWGGGQVVTIELGLIAEAEIADGNFSIPRVIILGVIKVILPDEDAELLKLQVNFLGVIDFQNEFIYFEAALFDSKLVGLELTGSLAFVVGWGSEGTFAISVGGFHPEFTDYPTVPTLPGAFREMARIGLSLLEGDRPKLTIEAYFAVTTNSVQFGAKVELLASGPMGFNLYGKLAFDAIFIFDPFSFSISLEAVVAIRQGTKVLFGIQLYGLLEGPRPWHVEGQVSFSLFFFTVRIPFSATWGNPPLEVGTVVADLLALLQEELNDQRNWRVITPDNNHQFVTLRELTELEQSLLIIHPFGELVFSQRLLPLEYKLEKYGQARPKDVDQFSITDVRIGTESAADRQSVRESFAAGEYTQLSESEKLSRKSFEKLISGFKLADTASLHTAHPHLECFLLDYELNYTMDDLPEPATGSVVMVDAAFRQLVRSAGISRSPLSWHGSNNALLNRPEAVQVAETAFAIASTSDLTDQADGFRAATLSEAYQYYDQLIAERPELATALQVVESYELATN